MSRMVGPSRPLRRVFLEPLLSATRDSSIVLTMYSYTITDTDTDTDRQTHRDTLRYNDTTDHVGAPTLQVPQTFSLNFPMTLQILRTPTFYIFWIIRSLTLVPIHSNNPILWTLILRTEYFKYPNIQSTPTLRTQHNKEPNILNTLAYIYLRQQIYPISNSQWPLTLHTILNTEFSYNVRCLRLRSACFVLHKI